MDLARQVADAKAAVREARERIARDLQAAQSSLEYEVTHLQGEHMDRLQAQIQTRELSDAWDAWAGVPKRRAQHQRILDKALERRRARCSDAGADAIMRRGAIMFSFSWVKLPWRL